MGDIYYIISKYESDVLVWMVNVKDLRLVAYLK